MYLKKLNSIVVETVFGITVVCYYSRSPHCKRHIACSLLFTLTLSSTVDTYGVTGVYVRLLIVSVLCCVPCCFPVMRSQRGSDASWRDDAELPAEVRR